MMDKIKTGLKWHDWDATFKNFLAARVKLYLIMLYDVKSCLSVILSIMLKMNIRSYVTRHVCKVLYS